MVAKKKRGHPDVEEVLSRPWCYYCERDFDDLKILISHQKAKHFKCERCGRRLNTAGGLSVHMNQVHKETLTTVDNSLPNRQGLEVEIFGMEGIPEDVAQAHNQRIIAGFYQAQADRQAATGNPGPGAQNGGQAKKPKLESPADLKKRLAEHKARKAEQAANGDSGNNTPMVDAAQNSPLGHSPGSFNASPFPPPQANYGATQGAGYGSYSQEPYAQPSVAYQQPPYQPPFSGPPGQPQYQPAYSPPQQYASSQSFPPYQQSPYPGPPPGSFGGYQVPPSHTPPQLGGLPNRPPSLPPAPGLPQRPSFATPALPVHQMQQMHQGPPPSGSWGANGWKAPEQNTAMSSAYPHPAGFPGTYATNAPDDLTSGTVREADDIDELIRMAEAGIKPPKKGELPAPPQQIQAPEVVSTTPAAVPDVKPEVVDKPEQIEKKSKKEKPIKMIYSDNEWSPEERMAKMPRYAFVPEGKTEPSPIETAAVSGTAVSVDA
ncbi:related to zinc finger protein [Rhynchosporium agropyri]|uniref:Related to zinc finger protein n=1 Tax=Rhynchosporium agropyri TaxID=914238 RepID=A0A1E1KLI2_9HELO|nr:related to zinc finger protein [Rhynchosporium agropyri]